jgi:hypothetical protein
LGTGCCAGAIDGEGADGGVWAKAVAASANR